MDERRNKRVEEALREELGEMIALEMADPRLEGVHLTDIHVSPDFKRAIVRIGIPKGADSKQVLEAMVHAKSFMKRELAARLDLFRIPELRFEADLSVASDPKLQNLLKRIKKGRPRDQDSSQKAQKKPEA